MSLIIILQGKFERENGTYCEVSQLRLLNRLTDRINLEGIARCVFSILSKCVGVHPNLDFVPLLE